jgi:lipopolysaccharide export system protein LptA
MRKKMFANGGYKQRIFVLLSLWVVVALFVMMSGAARAQKVPQTEKKVKIDKDQPIQIVSDRLDAYNEKKIVIFSGHAIATQGDKIIKADRLILHYKDHPEKPQKPEIKGMGAAGDLDQVEAEGHVTITQTSRVVTGNYAIFYQDTQKIIMTGNAVMRDGKNVIRGDRIVVFLDENRGVVESDENKRVTATIYPNEKKEEKK